MAINALSQILGGNLDLIPHIEHLAFQYITRQYVMASRVSVFDDMEGFNPRKVSEYLLPGIASELQENTDIPTSALARARRAQIDIKEVGDRYDITDRRVQTDLENILADVSFALGKAVGDKLEIDLINACLSYFIGGNLGSAATAYTIDKAIDAQHEFAKVQGNTNRGVLQHVIHPFQAREVMKDLIQFDGTTAGVDLTFREDAIRSWKVPGFDGLEIVQTSFLPRRIINRVRVNATGGTFRLSVAGQTTAAITVSATPATMATNIKNALEALVFTNGQTNGTWTVDGTGGLLDIDVTPPVGLYLYADQELQVAVDYANPTLKGQISAYDLTTGRTTGAIGLSLAGTSYGVDVQEISASCKSLMFFPSAIALDMRQAPTANFNLVKQGRTGEYALYTKYGVGYWQPDLGMTIETTASSAFAVP
jgi:hypothetical protein